MTRFPGAYLRMGITEMGRMLVIIAILILSGTNPYVQDKRSQSIPRFLRRLAYLPIQCEKRAQDSALRPAKQEPTLRSAAGVSAAAWQ